MENIGDNSIKRNWDFLGTFIQHFLVCFFDIENPNIESSGIIKPDIRLSTRIFFDIIHLF